jgi:hypothetical protein
MSKKLFAVTAGLLLIAGMGWKHLSAAEAKPKFTIQDWIDIYNLYGIYTRYTDMGYGDDGSNYASMFTPDGDFNNNNRENNPRVGREAQKTAIHNQQGGWVRDGRSVRHTTTNIVIEPSPEGARGSAYLLIFNITATPPFVESGGLYDDWLVKTSEGWKFKKRIYYTFQTFKPGMPQGMDFLFPTIKKY